MFLIQTVSKSSKRIGLLSLFFTQAFTADAATLRVGSALDPAVAGNYATVQAAVDASVAGDIILLSSEIFPENVGVAANPNITIRGSGPTNTRIDNINLQSSGVTVLDLYVVNNTSVNGDDCKLINIATGGDVSALSNNLTVESSKFGGGGRFYGDDNSIVANEFIGYLHFQYYKPDITSRAAANRAFVAGNTVFTTETTMRDARNDLYGWNPIYFDVLSDGVFQNNLVIRAGETSVGGFRDGTAENWIVQHNTFTMPGPTVDIYPRMGPTWYNNIIAKDEPPVIDGNGNLIGDPDFRAPESDDFTLSASSPAIDSGSGVDADGGQADIGYSGGVSAGDYSPASSASGQPVVGPIAINPGRIAPGEPIRIRFNARAQ